MPSPTVSPATPTASPAPAGPPISAANFGQLHTVARAQLENLQFLAWQPDGSLVVASRSQAAQLRPGASQLSPTFTAVGQEGIVAVSRTGLLATSTDQGSLDVRDLSGNIKTTLTLPGPFDGADFSPDGGRIAVNRLDKIAIDIYQLPSGSTLQELSGFQTAAPVYSAKFSPDGSQLICVSRATVQVQDIGSGSLYPRVQHEQFVSGTALDLQKKLLITTEGQSVTAWELATGAQKAHLDQGDIALQPILLQQASELLVGTSSALNLWDLAGQSRVGKLELPVRILALSPDGASLAVSDESGSIVVMRP